MLFPGIGYSLDRPLLHFSRRLAAGHGYEILPLPYAGFPAQVRGDREKLLQCLRIARRQTDEMLSGVDLSAYDQLLFIGKSIGTAVAAELADRAPIRARVRQVIYTPLAETFAVPVREAVVFTGADDPWVGRGDSPIPALCAERGLPCIVIPGANHSLETEDVQTDLETLRRVLEETERFIQKAAGRRAAGTGQEGPPWNGSA